MMGTELLSHDQQAVATFLADQDDGCQLVPVVDRKENAIFSEEPSFQALFIRGILRLCESSAWRYANVIGGRT